VQTECNVFGHLTAGLLLLNENVF